MWDRNSIKTSYTSDGSFESCLRHVSIETDFIVWTDWNPVTKEQILSGVLDPLSSYSGTKTFAERAVWEFAAEHPDINITVCKCAVLSLGAANLHVNLQSQ